MKKTILLLSITLLVSSCVSYQPGLNGKKKQRYGSITGQPVWNEKRSSNSSKLLLPLAGAGAGYAASGGRTIADYSESETRSIYTFGGLAVGLGINYLLKKVISKDRTYKSGDQNKWLSAYNKKYRSNYIFPNPSVNTDTHISIMRQEKYSQYTASYDKFIRKAESGYLDTREQSRALDKLDREFSVLPEKKKQKLISVINDSKEAYAEKSIITQIQRISLVTNDLDRARKYDRLKTDYYRDFQAMPLQKQEVYNSQIYDLVNSSFKSYVYSTSDKINKVSVYDINQVNMLNKLIEEYSNSAEPLFFKYYFDNLNLDNRLTQLKTSIVSNNIGVISDRILNASTIEQLTSVNETYLKYCLQKNENITLLNSAYSETKKLILLKQKREAKQRELESLLQKKKMLEEMTASGEPTQAQMQYAIGEQMRPKKEQIQRLANVNPDDPFLLLTKAFGGLANQNNVELRALQKLGCKESQLRPGYICDYTIDASVTSGAMANTYNQLKQAFGNAILTGRFLRVNGEWMLVERLK